MRCSSDQIRLTSEDRRLSTHFAFLRSEGRRALDCGCFSEVPGSIDFSYSWLMDFTGLSVLALLIYLWSFLIL